MINDFLPIKDFARIIGKKEDYIQDGLKNVPDDKKDSIVKEDLSEGPMIKYCYGTVNTLALHNQSNQHYNIVSKIENSYCWDRSGEKGQFWIGPATMSLKLSELFFSQLSKEFLDEGWNGYHSENKGFYELFREYTNTDTMLEDLQSILPKLYGANRSYLTTAGGNFVLSEIALDHYFINRCFLHKHYVSKYGFKPDSK